MTFTALNFVQNLSIYIGKVKGFWSISVNSKRKSQRILINIDRFIGKVKRILDFFFLEYAIDFGPKRPKGPRLGPLLNLCSVPRVPRGPDL